MKMSSYRYKLHIFVVIFIYDVEQMVANMFLVAVDRGKLSSIIAWPLFVFNAHGIELAKT